LNHILADLKRVRVVVHLFGKEVELVCDFKRYVRPFLEVETQQGRRILHESVVKEIIPLETQK
jgi:hypothetical protein